MAACLLYLYVTGWYLTLADVLLLTLDVILLVLFGTALSSLIIAPLSTNGQASAVGTIVSAGYGFICGAYMPISSFGSGLQKVISLLPGTYGTSLLRNHALRSVFAEMESLGIPQEILHGLRDGIDCNLYFFDTQVGIPAMYAVLIGATVAVTLGFIALCALRRK